MRFTEVIGAHPKPSDLDREALLRCVTECLDCGASCTACADANLGEGDVQDMVRCIRLCLDCADTCAATARVVTRQTETDLGVTRSTVQACAAACSSCAEESERHAAHHEHCRICAEICRQCEDACNQLLAAIG
jgi:hypothetical protein